jgi:hypothetical protein
LLPAGAACDPAVDSCTGGFTPTDGPDGGRIFVDPGCGPSADGGFACALQCK